MSIIFYSDLSKKGRKDGTKDIGSDVSTDEEDPDDLSDEEMELEEDDELAAEFRKEMEELGDDSDGNCLGFLFFLKTLKCYKLCSCVCFYHFTFIPAL